MKRIAAMSYVGASVVGLALFLGFAAGVYAAGYVVLADSNGLFPSKQVFNLYVPVMRFQRWTTNEPVTSGYVDSEGRRFTKRLR